MGKASSLSAALGLLAVLSIGSSTGCEKLIGSDFDRKFKLAGPGVGCYEKCEPPFDCNLATGKCQCEPLQCGDKGLPPHECGGALEINCQQPIDCGTCPGGFECTNAGNGEPNRCTPVNGAPCKPQTCAELGQTSGVHFSCGVLVDCDPSPACTEQCTRKQVCTADGCCTSNLELEEGACGLFADGCGRVIEVECEGGGICIDGVCCTPGPEEISCDGKQCGFNATSCEGISVECPGSCGEGEGQCQDQVTHAFCDMKCAPGGRKCPANPVCGLNPDGCGSFIECYGDCPGTTDVCTSELKCCTPRCPAKPEMCGANDDGCGGMIQCPGPCPAGTRCNNAGDGTYACTQSQP